MQLLQCMHFIELAQVLRVDQATSFVLLGLGHGRIRLEPGFLAFAYQLTTLRRLESLFFHSLQSLVTVRRCAFRGQSCVHVNLYVCCFLDSVLCVVRAVLMCTICAFLFIATSCIAARSLLSQGRFHRVFSSSRTLHFCSGADFFTRTSCICSVAVTCTSDLTTPRAL